MTWRTAMQGGVPEADVHARVAAMRRKLVDIVCAECRRRTSFVGVVADFSGTLQLAVWGPTVSVRPDRTGQPLWYWLSGRLPDPGETVDLHCFKHGALELDADTLAAAVERARRTGRRLRVAASPPQDNAVR